VRKEDVGGDARWRRGRRRLPAYGRPEPGLVELEGEHLAGIVAVEGVGHGEQRVLVARAMDEAFRLQGGRDVVLIERPPVPGVRGDEVEEHATDRRGYGGGADFSGRGIPT
jgi:hypothetical protein